MVAASSGPSAPGRENCAPPKLAYPVNCAPPEAGVPGEPRPAEAGVPGEPRPAEADEPGELRPAEAGGPGEPRPVEAGGPGELRPVEPDDAQPWGTIVGLQSGEELAEQLRIDGRAAKVDVSTGCERRQDGLAVFRAEVGQAQCLTLHADADAPIDGAGWPVWWRKLGRCLRLGHASLLRQPSACVQNERTVHGPSGEGSTPLSLGLHGSTRAASTPVRMAVPCRLLTRKRSARRATPRRCAIAASEVGKASWSCPRRASEHSRDRSDPSPAGPIT
jgi:hypothetical protein